MKIIGFKEIDKKIIKVKKGDILKYLSKKDKFFSGFGEVYFSEIKKNKTKGWNLHKKNTCILSVPFGSVVFNFIDVSAVSAVVALPVVFWFHVGTVPSILKLPLI